MHIGQALICRTVCKLCDKGSSRTGTFNVPRATKVWTNTSQCMQHCFFGPPLPDRQNAFTFLPAFQLPSTRVRPSRLSRKISKPHRALIDRSLREVCPRMFRACAACLATPVSSNIGTYSWKPWKLATAPTRASTTRIVGDQVLALVG